MKLAFITPTKYLETYASQGDMYLALAHLIDDEGKNEYASFHRREAQQGKRVVLDNGLFEGAQVTTDQLLRRAAAIDASCVCAPDVLFDSRETIKEFKQFIRAKHEFGLVAEVMGIPQADNPADWWECFQFMDMHPECNLVGLSILSIPKSFAGSAQGAEKWPITASRVHLLRQLYAYSDLSNHRITPCHLLGLGEHYGDITYAVHNLGRDVVSNDSSSCFVHGLKGKVYSPFGSIPGGKDHEKLDFSFQGPITKEQHLDILSNIEVAKRLAGGNNGTF